MFFLRKTVLHIETDTHQSEPIRISWLQSYKFQTAMKNKQKLSSSMEVLLVHFLVGIGTDIFSHTTADTLEVQTVCWTG